MNITTCQQYATLRGVAVPTVTLHARKLGIEKIANVYLFTPAQCKALDSSIVGKVGRPKKTGAPGLEGGPGGGQPGTP